MGISRSAVRPGADRFSFYEGPPRVKSPAAGFGFTVFFSFSFLQAALALVGPVRFRVRAECACHHLLSVSACLPSTRCCMLPERARRTGFGRGAPSIRTVVRMARPRKITGVSTNLQRCTLLWLTGLSAQISEAMSRAPWGITPSSRVRHSAINNFLATGATMPMRRMRRPPPAKRT